jgi:hypothetical protein
VIGREHIRRGPPASRFRLALARYRFALCKPCDGSTREGPLRRKARRRRGAFARHNFRDGTVLNVLIGAVCRRDLSQQLAATPDRPRLTPRAGRLASDRLAVTGPLRNGRVSPLSRDHSRSGTGGGFPPRRGSSRSRRMGRRANSGCVLHRLIAVVIPAWPDYAPDLVGRQAAGIGVAGRGRAGLDVHWKLFRPSDAKLRRSGKWSRCQDRGVYQNQPFGEQLR